MRTGTHIRKLGIFILVLSATPRGMTLLPTVMALLFLEVFLIIVTLHTRIWASSPGTLFLLGKCCTLGYHRSSTLDDQWLKVIHER